MSPALLFALAALGTSAPVRVTCCHPSPRGSLVALGDALGVVRIVDAARDSAFMQLPVNRGAVGAVRWSSDGRRLAIASSAPDSGAWVVTWSVWDVGSGTKRFETQQPGRDIGEFALDEQGERLLVIASSLGTYRASDRCALLHRLADGMCWELPSTSTIRAAAWVPGITAALTGDDAGRLALWSGNTGEELAATDWTGRSITCLAVTPDGARVVVGGDEVQLGAWSVPELRRVWARQTAGSGLWMLTDSIASIAILAPGDRAFVATRTWVACETLRIEDGSTGCVADAGGGNESTTRAVSSPDGSLLANWGTGMNCDAIRDSVDLRTLAPLGRTSFRHTLGSVGWTGDGRFLVLEGHGMSCLQVLDGKSLEFLHEIPLR